MIKIINDYFNDTIETINRMDKTVIEEICNIIIKTYKTNGTIYICGNGGSGSIATHICSDFNKCLNGELKTKISCVSLNDNSPLLSAIANDIGYDEIFKFQLTNKITSKDTLILLTGSGNSQNIINACEYANSIGAATISLTSFKGGLIKKISNTCLFFDINNMQIAEDLFLSCGHVIMRIIKEILAINN